MAMAAALIAGVVVLGGLTLAVTAYVLRTRCVARHWSAKLFFGMTSIGPSARRTLHTETTKGGDPSKVDKDGANNAAPEMPVLGYDNFATQPHRVLELHCHEPGGSKEHSSATNNEASGLPKINQAVLWIGQATLIVWQTNDSSRFRCASSIMHNGHTMGLQWTLACLPQPRCATVCYLTVTGAEVHCDQVIVRGNRFPISGKYGTASQGPDGSSSADSADTPIT